MIKTLKSGTIVEFKDYITGRDAQAIQAITYSGLKIGMEGQQGFDAQVMIQAENKSIELCVVSVTKGEAVITEGILDTVLDLPNEDVKEIMIEVNRLTGGLEKKTTPGA